MATKQNYIDEKKTPVHPIRWQCLICWREGRDEFPVTIEGAIRDHRLMVQKDIKIAAMQLLVIPGECTGNVVLTENPETRRVKRDPLPELPLEGAIEQI